MQEYWQPVVFAHHTNVSVFVHVQGYGVLSLYWCFRAVVCVQTYEQPAVFPVHVMDADLCKLSIQLFRQGQDFVDRKDSECDGKIELAV